VKTTTEGESANGITGLINQTGARTGALDVTNADSLLDAIAQASAVEVTPPTGGSSTAPTSSLCAS